MPVRLTEKLSRARTVIMQQQSDKEKILVWHAPEVECIAKGKVKKLYEFGCKVSLSTNLKPGKVGHFILSSNAIHGRPYDGHTLNYTIEKIKSIRAECQKEFM